MDTASLGGGGGLRRKGPSLSLLLLRLWGWRSEGSKQPECLLSCRSRSYSEVEEEGLRSPRNWQLMALGGSSLAQAATGLLDPQAHEGQQLLTCLLVTDKPM